MMPNGKNHSGLLLPYASLILSPYADSIPGEVHYSDPLA